jgi:hypothetical protein
MPGAAPVLRVQLVPARDDGRAASVPVFTSDCEATVAAGPVGPIRDVAEPQDPPVFGP